MNKYGHNMSWKIILGKILASEKELKDISYERLKKTLIHIKNLTDSDNMYLYVDSLIDINNITTGLNDIILRKVNIKSNGYDKMYMDNDLIKEKLYQLIDQFNKSKINHRDFYIVLLDNRHSFSGGNGKTCMILFVYNFN